MGEASDGNRVVFRNTAQHLMPATSNETLPGQYNIYPGFDIGPGKTKVGYSTVAVILSNYSRIVIDGYPGVLWENFRNHLDGELKLLGN